jgi:PhnB protein
LAVPDANHPAEADDVIRPVPVGYRAVTSWIISRDTARLLDFVKEVFGAEVIARVPNEDGTIGHAEFRIGDSIVMAFDAKEGWPDTPGFFRLYVEDGDAVYRRALEAGAVSVTEMTDLFFGDRVGRVRDPQGNVWWKLPGGLFVFFGDPDGNGWAVQQGSAPPRDA